MEQRSSEWYAARCGKITASRLNDLLATVKSGEAAGRRNYRMEIVCELLTGQSGESGYTNSYMQNGIDLEADARVCYEFAKGCSVVEAGFTVHPELPFFGASPDGTVGDDGLVEIKCGITATHVNWMLTGTVPAEHVKQIQGQLACTGRQWCDFVSYCPKLPVDLQLFVVRVYPDEVMIDTIIKEINKFWSEVQELTTKLTDLRG